MVGVVQEVVGGALVARINVGDADARPNPKGDVANLDRVAQFGLQPTAHVVNRIRAKLPEHERHEFIAADAADQPVIADYLAIFARLLAAARRRRCGRRCR